MKPLYRVAVAAVVLLGAATVASAAIPPLLNKLEVQKFVAADTTVANLRLAAHFTTLAARYEEDAARHKAAAVVFRANANRSATTNAALTCERRSSEATQWAAVARELATYHVRRASGQPATRPRGGAELQAGHGAPEPTAEQLHKLALTARTRVDHLELQEYYEIVARTKTAEANHHLRMAAGYVAGVRNGVSTASVTRERLARLARRAAQTAAEAANRHRILATVA